MYTPTGGSSCLNRIVSASQGTGLARAARPRISSVSATNADGSRSTNILPWLIETFMGTLRTPKLSFHQLEAGLCDVGHPLVCSRRAAAATEGEFPVKALHRA